MIHVNDLVRLKTKLLEDVRTHGVGIVVHVQSAPISQTVTVLWPHIGEQEKWSAEGLEVIGE